MQRADKRKYHYIYKITRDDGRYYIGMHSTDNLEDGYFGSGKRITRSIKKHGKDRHSKEILEFLPSRTDLKDREKQLITEEIRTDPLCMNIAPGGGGGLCSVEHAKAFSIAGNNSPKRDRYGAAAKSAITRKLLGIHCGPFRSAEFRSEMLKRAASSSAIEKRKSTFASRGHSRGVKNSQFGTCWVVKDGAPIKIKKDELDEYLGNGYSRGRKSGSVV